MTGDRSSIVPHGFSPASSRRNPSADSFKDDIQAIGQAVERLRRQSLGGTGGTGSSTPKAPEPKPDDDSAPWGTELSSPILRSVMGTGEGGGGDRTRQQQQQQQQQKRCGPSHRRPSPEDTGEGRHQRSSRDPPVRELQPATGGESRSSAEGDITLAASALDRTNISNGRLSLRELRSAEEARRFYSDERARARAGKTSGQDSSAPDQIGAPLPLQNEQASTGSSRGSRSSRSSRNRHQERNVNKRSIVSESPGARASAPASAPAAVIVSEEGTRGKEQDARRRATGNPPRLEDGAGPSSLKADGRFTASESSHVSVPVMAPSRSPSIGKSGEGGWGRKQGRRSSEKARGSSSSSSSSRRRSNGSIGSVDAGGAEETREEKEGRVEAAGEDGLPPPSGSLFELRDALKSREKELLRLKRDVSVVATSAEDFKNLAASLGSSHADKSQGGSFAFGRQRGNVYGNGGRGTEAEDGTLPGSKPVVHGSDSFSLGVEEQGVDEASRGSVAGREILAEPRSRHRREGRAADGSVLLRNSVDSSLAETVSSYRTSASSRRLMPPPAPPPRDQQQLQQQQFSSTLVSNGTADLAMSGSPLVVSAREGLRKVRSVLELRAREAGRAQSTAKDMAESLNDVSARLRRSERKRKAQAADLAEAKAKADAATNELSRVLASHRAKEKAAAAARKEERDRNDARERAAAGDLLAAPALQEQLREREAEISRLRDKLESASAELSEEQGSTASLRARLEASEREARRARERAVAAEEEAEAAATAQTAQAARAARTAAERAREEATAAVAADLRAAEEEGRRQEREASRARESLKAEMEGTARLALELEAAVRERTQAVEKLAAAEAETGRLQVELSAVSTTSEESQAAKRERDTAQERLRAAEAELANLTAALILAREGQEAERGRFDRESKRAAALAEELVASETRRKVQEEEILLVRKQVSRLDAKIEEDMSRAQAKSDAAAQATAAAASREATSLRARLREAEAELLASRQRERQASTNAEASLRAELAAAREAAETAEAALATALERAREAEAGAERAARAARQDKDTLKRSLVASQTACAELRGERSRLLSELDHAASSAAVAAATAAASVGPSSTLSSATGGGGEDGLGDGDPSSVRAAARAGERGGAASVLLRCADLEERLALAVAEASEARAEVQRLKRKVDASEREHKGAAAAAAATSARRNRRNDGVTGAYERPARSPEEAADSGSRFRGEGQGLYLDSLQDVLRESCSVMDRVATALSAAVDDGARGPRGGGGGGCGSDLDDPRWATTGEGRARERERRAAAGRNRSLAPAPTGQTSGRSSGRRRRRRAFSVDSRSSQAGDPPRRRHRPQDDDDGDGDDDDDDGFGEGSRRGGGRSSTSDGSPRVVSRAEVREASERLRFEAARLLGVRTEELKMAEDKVARLRQDVRDTEEREAELTARLEESRELSREQTGFVEGVWKERHRLESELNARREENDRLRVSENAARKAAAVLDGRAEELSTALRQERARARREAEAAVAAEARDAMEALRRQLDDLRKEVEQSKGGKEALLVRGSGGGQGGDRPMMEEVSGPAGVTLVGGGGDGGEGGRANDGAGWGSYAKEQRGGGRVGFATAAGVGGVAPPASPPPSLTVLEGEFQRLRAKYEKAKGRIVALEELVTASRRVSAQARKEFQGALEALKMSQELLLRIHRQRQSQDAGDLTGGGPAAVSGPQDAPSTPAATQSTPARALDDRQPHTTAQDEGPLRVSTADAASAAAPGGVSAAGRVEDISMSAAAAGPAVAASTDAHVQELAAQASKLRGMSGNVKRLLELAAGEVQGALEDTRDSLGVAGAAAAVSAAVSGGTQTEDSFGPSKESFDALEEELRGIKATVGMLEVEKSQLDGRLGAAVADLSEVQSRLREKTAEALLLEASVSRLETECRQARETVSAASDRLAMAAEVEKELSDTRARLSAALATQGELRGRCAELSLASGAFAAEVAKQKEERAKSQERAQRAAEASAAKLREREAGFSRAAETAASEAAAARSRLEKELAATRAEAKEIDSDVAQVLDALASSERERRRLEAELERQAKMADAARLATRAAEGAAAHMQEDVDRERRALCEKAGRLEGVVQLGASRVKESLEAETERRQRLERECKVLAARATDLEAALISSSSGARKAAELAAETEARHERDIEALREETTGLRATLAAKEAEAESAAAGARAEVEGAVDREREKWEEEKGRLRAAAAREQGAALAAAVADAAERAHREGRTEEQRRTADGRERERRESAALRREVSEMTDSLQAERRLRAEATQELSALRRKVARLEAALAQANAAALEAGETSRVMAANDPMFYLRAEMRSVIDSLEPEKDYGGRSGVGDAQRRRRGSGNNEGGDGNELEQQRWEEELEEEKHEAPVQVGRTGMPDQGVIDSAGRLRPESIVARAAGKDDAARTTSAATDPSEPPAVRDRAGNGFFLSRNDALHSTTRPRRSSAEPPGSEAGPPAAPAAASVGDATDANHTRGHAAARQMARRVAVPEQAPAVVAARPRSRLPGDEPTSGVPLKSVVDVDVDDDDDDDGNSSFSSVRSGLSSTTRTSGMSSSLALAARPPQAPTRRGSVVVRGDWKAGQREAFSELDRKGSASSSRAFGGGGDFRGGGTW